MHRDSLQKIAGTYLRAVATRAFVLDGARYEPPGRLVVTPAVFCGYTCPPACAGCCPRFTLIYLPSEPHPYPLAPRTVEVDGRAALLFEDPQSDHDSPKCRNVDWATGRCGIHGRQPFSCDFELLRFTWAADGSWARLGTRLFGRGWAMGRTDGGRGARCEILPATAEWRDDSLRKLFRLQEWAEHLRVETHLAAAVLPWVASGPHDEELVVVNGAG